MDMIEAYLNAVAAQLPQQAREDITAELRDLILNRCEAKEEELGRALSDEERQAILRDIGHPLVVAARYRQGPDHLIGPQWLPYWLFGVKAGVLILATAFLLGLLFDLITGPSNVGHTIGQALHGFFWSALSLVGVATLVAAFLEYNGIKPRWLTRWRVNDLAAFSISDPAAWRALLPIRSKQANRWPGGEHLAPLIFHVLFLLWWTNVLVVSGWSNFQLHGHHVTIMGAPIWSALHDAILFYVLACIVVDLIGLALPYAV
jgi:hypothetical protein